MKRSVIRFLALALLIIILGAGLVSCGGKLSGTYASAAEDDRTTYKFSFFGDKLVWNYDGVDIEGSYEIEGDKIYITFLGDRQEKSFSKKGKSLFIDDVEYLKQ